MDFTQPISYNGWTASLTRTAGGAPLSGYVVESFEPAPVQVSGYLDKRAVQDGLDAADVYLGGREFTMIVATYGSTLGDFWDKAQDLFAAFSPTLALASDTYHQGFIPLAFYQPTANVASWPTSAYPSGMPLVYQCRPSRPPQYSLRRDEVGGDSGAGVAKRFTVSLLARDPRKYVAAAQSISVTTSTQTATYRGDYPTFPVVTFSLTAAGSSAITFTFDGLSTVVDMSAQTTGTWILDYSRKSLTKNLVDFTRYITSDNFVQIQSGSTFRGSNMTNTSSVVLSYYEAFA